MSRPLVIDVWDDVNGSPRIRFTAGNGRTLLASESYEGGARKATATVDLITRKIYAGDFVVKRNGVPVDD
jgi:uncharacterized protein YegP (UPF0339 family)